MSEQKASSGILMTPDQLKDIVSGAVAAAVAEVRKPAPPTDKELRELAAQQEERAANAQDVKDRERLQREYQKVCAHTQDRNRDSGKTACIFVNQDFPNRPNGGRYLICQNCQAKIVPGQPLEGVDKWNQPLSPPDFIYDTVLFNRHFQMIRQGD